MRVQTDGMTLSASKVVWLTFKWLVVPGALGAVGYYVIGPRIGQVPALEMGAKKVQSIVRRDSGEDTEVSTPDGGVTDASGPDVSISVEKADRKPRSRSTSSSSSSSTRRRSTSNDPKPPAPKRPEGESADPASGGAAVPPPTTGEDPVVPPPATTGTGTGTGI